MTKEDYVSLEAAKLLKEKGFNEPVFSQYTKRGSVWICQEPENFNESTGCFSRPTLYEAQKWLRSVKGLHVEVIYMSEDYWLYEILTIPNHNLIGLSDRKNVKYNSYEEALSAGVFEALNLI